MRLLSALLAAPFCVLQAQMAAPAPGATNGTKTQLKRADYGKWESLGGGTLSPDGKWFSYTITKQSGGSELRYRMIASEDTGRVVRGASGVVFTANGKWLIYTINPAAETEGAGGRGAGGRGGRGGAPAADAGAGGSATRNRLVIVNLASGGQQTIPEVQSFTLSADERYIALRRYPPAQRASRGADLVIHGMDGTRPDLTLGAVADYGWSPVGATMAMTIDVEGRTGNGVQLLDAASGTLRPLEASDNRYSALLWRRAVNDLIVMRTRIDTAYADTGYVVVAWKDVTTPGSRPLTFDFTAHRSFPAGMRVSPFRAANWSDDGNSIFVGIGTREPKPAPAPGGRGAGGRGEAEPPGAAGVEVWHSKDVRQYTQQRLQAAQERTRTTLGVWHFGTNTFVRLSEDPLEAVTMSANNKAAIAATDSLYQRESMFGRPYRDVYTIDMTTGARKKVLTRNFGATRLSPNGKYLAYAQGGHWWMMDLASGKTSNLTATIKSSFMNLEDDHPTAERAPYGLVTWTTGEDAVVLYDRFDVWRINVDGTNAVRLTKGREDSTVYRRFAIDTDERTIDPAKPMYLTAFGEFSKKSGYARLWSGEVEKLVWLDKSVTALQKADSADVWLYQRQTYEESPNYFIVSSQFAQAKQMTRTNVQQADHYWGKQELFTYKTKTLGSQQAMLTYPADYKPGVKYPMVVYFYEKLSNGFHSYVAPSDRAVYSTQVFSQEGYFVLRPDIAFKAREPGVSALECVTAAINAVVARGLVDPKKIGTMGHSWGGYESAYIATHANGLIQAAIAGAPLTDLISFYGYTSGNSGAGETGHFEVGQERMQVPFWEDPQAWIRNSTVFAIDKLNVPLLLEEGDQDGNVNPFQSQELYNFARRLGKQVVYLVYNGENHNLAQRNNQMDYAQRQIEWFAHYLKGEPAAKWIVEGETYSERQKLLRPAGAGGAGSPPPPVQGGGGRGRGGM